MADEGNLVNPFLERALALAEQNVRTAAGGPFGAVVVRDGRIVAEGPNQVAATCDPTAHAEVVAIRRAALAVGTFDLSGCELYTSCEPCPMCLGAVYWARLDRVYFGCTQHDAAEAGFDDALIYTEFAKPHAERSIPLLGLDREQCLTAFRLWRTAIAKAPH